MSLQQRYTLIYYSPVGRLGQYLAKMKRVQTADLVAYIERHDLDVAYIFEGWPKLEGAQQ